jgi:probable rRNA maturation factor
MNLEISVECDSWNVEKVELITKECADVVFSEVGLDGNNLEICFLFTDNEEMRVLNRTYRGIDKPTNVLSFPMETPLSEGSYCILGSIALAFEIIAQEAQDQGKSIRNHLQHLIVHGLLHLMGHDHVEESGIERMEALEISILGKLGIKNPYEEICYDVES